MTGRFFADLDLVSQQRRAAHLNAARMHEQSSEFYRGLQNAFASFALEGEVRRAHMAAEAARLLAERERDHVERLECNGCWLAASSGTRRR
jgi:hypothetical protein